MQIASMSNAVTTELHKGDQRRIGGGHTPPPGGYLDPASRFLDQFSDHMFALYGVTALGYSSQEGTTVRVRCSDYGFAAIADRVLRDECVGAHLIFTDQRGNEFDMTKPTPAWADYPSNLARDVAAMPGVVSYRYPSESAVVFDLQNRQVADTLDQIIEPVLGGKLKVYFRDASKDDSPS